MNLITLGYFIGLDIFLTAISLFGQLWFTCALKKSTKLGPFATKLLDGKEAFVKLSTSYWNCQSTFESG